MTDGLEFLQRWFNDQTDGDWEHGDGITIESLDNPGWYLTVGLTGTALEGRTVSRQERRDGEDSWLHFWSDGSRFEAACGPVGLVQAIEAFQQFVEGWRAEATQ